MFENEYIRAALVAFLTAALYTLYVKFTDKDEKKLAVKFMQVFVSALVSGVVFTFISNGTGGDDLASLPFEAGGIADF